MTLPLWMANKNKIMFKKIFFLFVFLAAGFAAFSQDFPPKPNTLVTDYTNSLTTDEKAQLEAKLVAFDDTSSNQVAIVLMHSVGDNDIAEYGVQLGRKWGIGQKAHNNGVLILAAMDQHKITIQVAYGLEGALPDAVASQIIENDIKPAFRNNTYYAGLDAAVNDIIKYTKGEYKADKKAANNNGDNAGGGGIAILMIIVIVVLILIFRNRGGGGQIIGGRGGASPFWWFLAGDILGGSGRGGGWGGGSGGGGSGGGFGGFGGGSFGGGGASGSW